MTPHFPRHNGHIWLYSERQWRRWCCLMEDQQMLACWFPKCERLGSLNICTN